MQSLRLLCRELKCVDRCYYFSLLALDICVLWFVTDWDGVPLMFQIHFCSCNKSDWGYMLHEAASAAIFVLFFGGATLSLLQLLQRSYMLHEITNVLQNLRCCMSVCLRETEIEQSHLCCYFNLFLVLYFLSMFYKKIILFNSISFKTFKISFKSFPHPFFFFTYLCVSRLAFLVKFLMWFF